MRASETEPQAYVGGRYRILSLLGQGGMGAVYRVVDQHDGRELACKRLRVPPGHEQTAAELFEREFYTLAELAHPRIIEVYDYGVDAEGAYYTMELLHGQDLRELGKCEWRTACAILRDVASSLAILHSRRLLHCDISPRNVRCTADGRAKLLDFGAMAPMGVTKRVVGTPPFVSPEMLQMQALDARADLYGLGALAYWLLTGRHAYPARSFADLRALWHTPPRPPIELEPSLPPALSELVLDCLRVNRNARPRSAGVVMERLSAIAGLPFDEQLDVAQAYLTMPTLVGRAAQLTRVREQLLAQKEGASFAVRGPGGSGRSRLLDSYVLEAKLLGWQALRTDAGDAASGSYGVARVLCQQLFALAPETARAAASLHASVLAHVLGPELVNSAAAAEAPPRQNLLLALRDFVLTVARSMRLFIAVDDAERVDEASISLLAALAQKAKRRSLCLVFALDPESERNGALDLLFEASEAIELPPLNESESEELVRSLFGGANHSVTLARRLHEIARGNPRATLQLAEHLVERGVVRYEAGAFVLPEHVLESDLPRSFAAALARRAATLDADALELGRVLALTDPSELPASSYTALTKHGDRALTYRMLDQLVRAKILEVEGDRYRLSNATWREVLCNELEPATRVELHARLARVFEPSGTVARRAYHLMESAQPEAAIRVLLAQYLKDPNEPRDPLEDYVPGILDLLERAAASAQALRLPAPWRVELLMKAAGASQFLGDRARFLRVGPKLLAQLEVEAGLHDYAATDPKLEPMARLTLALTETQARYDRTPEAERGLAPVDAVRELSRLCAMYAGICSGATDLKLLSTIPSLTPLAALSPAIGAIQGFVDGSRAILQGRSERAHLLLGALLERVSQPDRAGLGELYQRSMRLGLLYIIGQIEASAGLPDAGARVAELERVPGHRVNAQRIHFLCQLMQANPDEAAAAQRRAEMVMLQDGQMQRYPGTSARLALFVHALMDDLTGVKQFTDEVARTARLYPEWYVLLQCGRAHYRRLQGDLAGALELVEAVLPRSGPLQHRDWIWLAASHVQLVTALGRADEGVALGLEYVAICEREGLHPNSRWVAHATAEALLAAGRAADALALADRLIAELHERGVRGLALGAKYEVRARCAIALRDQVSFQHYSTLCAAEYRPARNAACAAKYERLQREAEAAGMISIRSTEPPPSAVAELTSRATISSTINSRLLECADSSMRTRCTLSILADAIRAERAYLYGLREGKLTLLCALPERAPPEQLQTAIANFLQRELGDEQVTVVASPKQALGGKPGADVRDDDADLDGDTRLSTSTFADDEGTLYPLLLSSRRDGQPVIAAVAAVSERRGLRRMPDGSLLESLAVALLEHDDVDPVTCFK